MLSRVSKRGLSSLTTALNKNALVDIRSPQGCRWTECPEAGPGPGIHDHNPRNTLPNQSGNDQVRRAERQSVRKRTRNYRSHR